MGTHRQGITIAALALASAFVLSNSTQAASIYHSTFDALDSDYALTQQEAPDLWETNDPYVAGTGAGQIEMVARLAGYSTPEETDLWVVLGGLAANDVPAVAERAVPGSFSVSVWKPFSSDGLLNGDGGANTIRLEVDFAITSSGLGRPEEDSFSWSFADADGNSIFRLALEPAGTVPETLALKWYNSAGQVTPTPNSLAYDAIYQLQVEVAMDDPSRDAFTVRIRDGFGVTSTVLNNVALAEGAAASLARIGVRWDILDPAVDANGDPARYGANSIVFNDFSIATVPEPGAACLLTAGALLGIARRPRRRR